MARGRIIRDTISRDGRVAQLTDQSALLFSWALPHADAEGRLPGDPGAVREQVVPLRPWSDTDVDAYMAEWTLTVDEASGLPRPLALIYSVDGCRVVAFAGWLKNQPRHFRRGARSGLPPPPTDMRLDRPAAKRQSGPAAERPVSHSVSARAHGLGSSPREVDSGRASKPAAADPPGREQIDWLSAEAERHFGRRMLPLKPSQVESACASIDRLGREAAGRVVAAKAAAGMEPKSLAYFLPVLEDADATFGREPAGGYRTTELMNLAERLEASGR